MTRKLIFTIIVLSFAALELLVVRQEQINTVNEMTRLHVEIDTCVSIVDALRIEIETASSPTILSNAETNAGVRDGNE
jgi:cell division protein FtsL